MNNLIRYIWKRHNFLVFVILELISFVLIYYNTSYQRSAIISSSNRISGNLYNTIHSFNEYIGLKNINDQLADENAILRTQSLNSYYSYDDCYYSTIDSVYIQQYQYISAKVINNSVNKRNNYLTLNKGSIHGIAPEMGVISNDGIVGIIISVSDHFSVVMSFLHKDCPVNSRIKKTGDYGLLVWEPYNSKTAKLIDIPGHVNVLRGDTIITSSFSAIFPEGIPVGVIESANKESINSNLNVQVNLFTNFRKLSHVYIVENLLKKEKQKLENMTLIE